MRELVSRYIEADNDGNPISYVELACDVTEVNALPTTGIADGSNVLITDTTTPAVTVKFFNEMNSAWVEG